MSYFIIDDKILESTETFSIDLIDVSPCGTVGSDDSTTIEIYDDDSKDFTFPISDLFTASFQPSQNWKQDSSKLTTYCMREIM